jgi:hypothetical protein
MITISKYLIFILLYFILICYSAHGQIQNGLVINEKDKKPIEFVNIGVIGKGIGTTSNIYGSFNINIENQFNNDSLRFSSIGYEPYAIKVSEFKQLQNKTIALKEKYYEFKEVVISPKIFKSKILGYTSHSKALQLIPPDSLGYEGGVYLKIKKSAKLNKININVIECTIDTVFYRINIYKVVGKKDFQNILIKPIYFTIAKDKVKDRISIDISNENICVKGDCLVTFEKVKYLGKGNLKFSGSISGRTYYRLTSQANWQTLPVGIGLSVEANVEK